MHVVLFLGGAWASTLWSLTWVSSRPHKYICWNRGITRDTNQCHTAETWQLCGVDPVPLSPEKWEWITVPVMPGLSSWPPRPVVDSSHPLPIPTPSAPHSCWKWAGEGDPENRVLCADTTPASGGEEV